MNLMAERRSEVFEMHLFDDDARVEQTLCGAETSTEERRAVSGYLKDRLGGAPVGTVCEGCKALTVAFAENRVRHLEAEGHEEETEAYRQLAHALARETGLEVTSG